MLAHAGRAKLLVIVRFDSIKIGERIVMVGKLRAGRKKKSGKREPNGRLERKVDVVAVAASMPHRRWIPSVIENGKVTDQRTSEKAENPFGRLYLIGPIFGISKEEYDIGQKFRKDYLRFQSFVASPRGGAPSLIGKLSASDYSEGDAPLPVRVFEPMDEKKYAQRYRDAYDAYDAAFCAARTDENGKRSQFPLNVLAGVLLHEKELQPGDREFLRVALGRLKKHYEKPKQQRARSA